MTDFSSEASPPATADRWGEGAVVMTFYSEKKTSVPRSGAIKLLIEGGVSVCRALGHSVVESVKITALTSFDP